MKTPAPLAPPPVHAPRSDPDGPALVPFRDLPVAPDLAPYVVGIRVHETVERAEPHTVLPGPLPVLGCRWSGALRALECGGERRMAQSGLTGLLAGPARYRPDAGTRTVLVALRPEAAPLLLGVDAAESVGRETPLDGFLAPSLTRELEARTADAATDDEASAAIHALLRAAVADRRPVPGAVRTAVSAILASRGTVRIERVAEVSTVGRRQLERLFRAHVGVSPKRLASLARFGWAAARLRRGDAGAELALRAGYADQAHFIRSFRELAGTSPGRFTASLPGASHSFNTGA
jgi:AraC-like DNA-binding protein